MSSATLMDNSSMELIQKKPYFFSVSAVSDYIPTFPQTGKLKKEDIGNSWDLSLKKNIDILQTIDKSQIYSIGFKAELDKDNALSNAKNMLKNKNIDAVCLNIINQDNPFGSDTNTIDFITKDNNTQTISGDKLDISLELINTLETIHND